MNDDLKRIAKGELIGLKAEVVESLNKTSKGIKGKITNETKYTLTINGKMVLKKNITLKINNTRLIGKILEGRPQDRIKVKL